MLCCFLSSFWYIANKLTGYEIWLYCSLRFSLINKLCCLFRYLLHHSRHKVKVVHIWLKGNFKWVIILLTLQELVCFKYMMYDVLYIFNFYFHNDIELWKCFTPKGDFFLVVGILSTLINYIIEVRKQFDFYCF